MSQTDDRTGSAHMDDESEQNNLDPSSSEVNKRGRFMTANRTYLKKVVPEYKSPTPLNFVVLHPNSNLNFGKCSTFVS